MFRAISLAVSFFSGLALPWIYPDLKTALIGMLSAGPAERAIRASSFERARAAVAAAIEPYRAAGDSYRLNNTFR